ncbi:hypothetical protein BYT27DRAFT_7115832 [Phlegmacium glaucopus]|nr:hypothetical protein BYT27DRAFT_7115832 [Phlegmacium glaucopus]
MSTLNSPAFAGISNVIESTTVTLDEMGAIDADLEDERGTVPDLSSDDFEPHEQADNNGSSALISQWEHTILGASKGVSDGTHQEYCRLIEACASFLVSKGLIKKREEFFSQTPPKEAPTLIIAWIMNE